MDHKHKIRIGITQGDTNGIGYEVILKAFEDPTMFELCTPIVYGSSKIASYHRKSLNLNTNFTGISSAAEAAPDRLNIVNVQEEDTKIELSKPTAEAGKAAYAALERAVEDAKEGAFDVLVTAPINKNTIQNDNFHFAGHTEYLEERLGNGQKSLMILMKGDLRVALVTNHLPISQVPAAITKERIMEKARILNQSLKRDFGKGRPRIAILALNPHAGDNGLLGKEEEEIISPAIRELNEEEGIYCFGPYPADGFFGSDKLSQFDAVLAMYHDQGLAPFKALCMDEGVNYTAGLPIVRTSPAHGTAYDIAGKGVASPESFRQALYTAIDIFRARRADDEARRNPVHKQYVNSRDDSDKLKNIPEEKD
ncbi:MAG: 4-hydroxythreonine-4-phosphate dehydrogenase PdxA [Bacteroidaceae bacterium]|jgi:4-hydroxythreonine-4-phosphate dehydrogenase